MWKVPNYSLHLSPSLLLWKVPPTPVNQGSLRKRLCGRFPHFFPNSLSFGSSAIEKVLSKMTRLSSWVLCSKWLSPSKRFFGKVPQTVRLTVPFGFLGKWLLLQQRFCEGFRQLFFTFLQMAAGSLEGSANCALHLSPSLLPGSKLHELLTCLIHINAVCRK